WSGPCTRPASILLAPPDRALGTKRSRGSERIETVLVDGFRWRIITSSLLIPVTPCEHRPYAGFCTFKAQRDVEPIMRMFCVPASAPLAGAEVKFFRSIRWISWFRYQP